MKYALAFLIAFTTAASANMNEDAYEEPVEVTVENHQYDGWVLTYNNLETFTLNAETSHQLDNGESIAWRFKRTDNKPCRLEGVNPIMCADIIEVFKVPPGYIAIPDSVQLLEGESTTILIVPDLTS